MAGIGLVVLGWLVALRSPCSAGVSLPVEQIEQV
jgi:hypothetical protein